MENSAYVAFVKDEYVGTFNSIDSFEDYVINEYRPCSWIDVVFSVINFADEGRYFFNMFAENMEYETWEFKVFKQEECSYGNV